MMKKFGVLFACALMACCAMAVEVDVMSFNIRYGTAKDGDNHWNLRKGLVFDVIRDKAPDVIGLQEALRFQIDEIRKALPVYGEIGEGREGGEKGEYSSILYNLNRFELSDSGTFWLSDTPERPSNHWGNTCIRVCTWARLVDKKTKQGFYMFNTHLDHESQKARELGSRLIAQRIKARKQNEPFVLTGDFNASEDNPAILFLKRGDPTDTEKPLLMVDTFRQLHPDEKVVGTFHSFKGTRTNAKIDYIFVLPGTEVISAEIIHSPEGKPCPSDHFPVTAKLRL